MENTMSGNTIWYVLAVLGLIYIILTIRNRTRSKRRKSRGFMEGRRKGDRED